MNWVNCMEKSLYILNNVKVSLAGDLHSLRGVGAQARRGLRKWNARRAPETLYNFLIF